MDAPDSRPRSRVVIWVEWAAVVGLIGGVAGYLLWKPLDPMGDPQAARALALVQTHPARSAPSVRQALDAVLKAHRAADRTPSISDWTVRRDETGGEHGYRVRVVVRLPGDRADRWIEWEFLWRVTLAPPAVIPLSRPAVEIMP